MTSIPSLPWSNPERAQAFAQWLQTIASTQRLDISSLSIASADASFRRYLRIHTIDQGTRIIMDAPPEHEDCHAYVHVARLLESAGIHVPTIDAWDEAHGFMLLGDLGNTTMLQGMDMKDFAFNQHWYAQARDILVRMQLASRPNTLPAYDDAVLQRELQLFPDWYVAQHKKQVWSDTHKDLWQTMCEHIKKPLLRQPKVWVHRDFMPRNLMLPIQPDGPLGVLDFQDALYGPITYDIASLMRDAFHSWDEEHVLDVTVRYWEQAKRAGLLDYEDWHQDFAAFYRAVDYMALQRHLKVAGIFARLTLRDGKPRYLEDAPRFIGYIRNTCLRYRELKPLLGLIDSLEPAPTVSAFSFGRL